MAIETSCTTVTGNIVRGTRSASGAEHFVRYGGTIRLQSSFFQKVGLPMHSLYPGTINVGIRPYSFQILHPQLIAGHVHWHPEREDVEETFWFVSCALRYAESTYDGYVYFPHPSTKFGNFPGYQLIEILAPFVPNIQYGKEITLLLPQDQIRIVNPSQRLFG